MGDAPEQRAPGIWDLAALARPGEAQPAGSSAGPEQPPPPAAQTLPAAHTAPAAQTAPARDAAAPLTAAPGSAPPAPPTPAPVPASAESWPRLLNAPSAVPVARPRAARSTRRWRIALVAAAVLVLVGVAVAVLPHGRSGTSARAPVAGTPAGGVPLPLPTRSTAGQGSGPDATAPSPTDTSGPTDASSPSGPPSPETTAQREARALDTLNSLHEQDRAQVVFSGQYAAQLASKVVGIVDPLQIAANGTHTFYASDILTEHLALRQGDNRGASVVLLLSTDYGKGQLYQGQPLWITFALGPFDSAAAVNSWCTARFPQLSGDALADQCTSRRLDPRR